MDKLYIIREYLEKEFNKNPDSSLSRDDIATALGMWPSEVKNALSKLISQGFIAEESGKYIKQRSKDVAYNKSIGSIQNTYRKAFSNIVGQTSSMKNQIQIAKAAVIYPPNGLHTLIIGESGVGKSMFAEEMWRFSVELSGKNKPFVLFNCAEYADNPQLLLSHLFGHCKGAFTGANNDSEGLVEKANNGILFLDEIHRLSSVGQEMLFTLIDKGVYKRLGDSEDRKANIMIIGATTENPDNVMLQTFMRRIPVVIKLPSLAERPLRDHIELVTNFLSRESNRLQKAIYLTGNACRSIVLQQTNANIGDMKNTLQLACAKSYLSYLMQGEKDEFITVDVSDLPSITISKEKEKEANNNHLVNHFFNSGISVFPDNRVEPVSENDDYEVALDLYRYVEKRIREYASKPISNEEIEKKIAKDLEIQYKEMIKKIGFDMEENKAIHSVISSEAFQAADRLLTKAADFFNQPYSKEVQAALALHFQQLKERVLNGKMLPSSLIRKIAKTKYTDELAFTKAYLPSISSILKIKIPDEEMNYLAVFLHQSNPGKKEGVGLVVVAHGDKTASGMAGFANELLSTDIVKHVDAPITKSISQLTDEIVETVKEADNGKGVVILADMGSFISIKETIKEKTNIDVKIIPNVSTVLVLEAAKFLISSDDDLKEVYSSLVNRYINYFNTVFQIGKYENVHNEDKENYQKSAIVVCSTGIGSAEKLKNILLEKVEAIGDVRIYPMSIADDIKAKARELGDSLAFVAGNSDPGVEGVPFYSTESILMGNGLYNINLLLINNDAVEKENPTVDKEYIINLISKRIDRFAPNFPGEEVIKDGYKIAETVCNEVLHKDLETDVIVRVIVHYACLLERIKANDLTLMPEWYAEISDEEKERNNKIMEIINQALSKYGYVIPEEELAYFTLVF